MPLRLDLRRLPAAALGGLGLMAAPALAQEMPPPTTVGGPVTEEDLLQRLQQIDGRVSIPDQKAGVLEQPGGRDWSTFNEDALLWIGAVAIVGMIVLLAVFYLWRGRIRVQSGRSGVTILRFAAFERLIHWITATCFIILALTGLNVTFGKPLLLPLIGNEAFSTLAIWGKHAHNYLAWPFMLGILVMLVIWIKDNIPNRVDWAWLRAGGGMVDESHPAAERFNAGQKAIFWAVVLGGVALSLSGLILLFPFAVADIDGMQWAQIAHAVVALVMIAVIIAHIYIGTLGMEGAFDAMGSGQVDLNWAEEHHRLWVEKERAKARTPEPGGRAPAPAE